MSDQRPQYGEFATHEEQRRAAGLPPVVPVVEQEAPAPVQPAPASGRRRPVDRFVTIALLAYGLVNVVVTGLSYLDLTSVMNQSMAILGIDGEFTNYAQGKIWGTAAAIVLVLGWCATAALSVRRLRSGRLSWWLPVVGAIVSGILASFCLAVPMMGDPAFIAYLDQMAAQ